jgi:two-component system nitrate/nitrite response regulator NarL
MPYARALAVDRSPNDAAPPRAITVVLAQHHPMMMAGMEQLLSADPDLRVVARCASAEQMVRAIREHKPEVVVSDYALPNFRGLAVLRDLNGELKHTRIILLAESIQQDELLEAMGLGVKGVILKEMPGATLVRCIHKVVAGGVWLENPSASAAIETLLQRQAGAREIVSVLTPREIATLRAIASGMRNKDAALALGIAEGTVKIHLHRMYEKLNVTGRLELVLYARDRGWL